MKNVLLFVSLFAASLATHAATFQGSTSGTFENPTGPSGMVTTGVGSNEFTWGTGANFYNDGEYINSGPSELSFNGKSFDTEINTAFKVGDLEFYNGTIWSGTQATSVDFSLKFDFVTPNNMVQNFTYNFGLDNTLNSYPNPDGDFVFGLSAVPQSLFSYEGKDYYFELLGFYDGQGELSDSIFAEELAGQTAHLMGQFSSLPSEVPLPAAVWLFGSGLMGFMAIRRRAKSQQA